MEPNWTEGARRAMELARRLAMAVGAEEISPLHVLWGLSRAECRAAELMNGHGLTQAVIQRGFPAESAAAVNDNDLVEGDAGEDVSTHRAVGEARRRAKAGGAEVGSEHLLFGLSRIESQASALLREHGLDAATVEKHLGPGHHAIGAPIDIDFEIEWKGASESANSAAESPLVESAHDVESPPSRLPLISDEVDVLRILDAAANRAAEGLRAIEDYVRFALDDAHLTRQLKECRHELRHALGTLGVGRLSGARDTLGDVGTDVRTEAEGCRGETADVLVANFKRVQEATRTLEEYGKLMGPALVEVFSRVRYRAYTLEKSVLTARRSQERLQGRNLYLLVTEALCRTGIERVIRGALAGGVGVVQLREKSMDDRRLLDLARRVRGWTREAGALLIVNDRPDLAVLAEADGVHVGQEELSVCDARRIVGVDRLVGVSTHDIAQARQAVLDGADYLGVGPLFTSRTKSFGQLAGIEFVRQAGSEIALPWYAIGGIDAHNLGQVLEAGASRVAVSAAVCGAEDPAAAARELVAQLAARGA